MRRARGFGDAAPGYPARVLMLLLVLLLTVSLLGLVGLAVALAAGTARLLGHEPTGDVALLRRELGRQVGAARQAAGPRLRQLRETTTSQR